MDISQLKNVIRKGTISTVDGARCCARVVFEDKEDLVSDELPILLPFSFRSKGYWLPEVGTPVVCVFTMNPSGNGLTDGFVVGAYYDDDHPPAEINPDVRSIRFPDGSYLRYDHGDIELHASGNVVITGAKVNIN